MRNLDVLATLHALRSTTLNTAASAVILAGRIVTRSQQRDGRGRFLSRAWQRQAETFSAADVAWFRSSVGA